MIVFPERMWANIESSRGLIFSQQVLLALVDKGAAREEAYKVVQRNAMRSWDEGEDFPKLLRSDPEAVAYLSQEELDKIFDYSYYTKYVDHTFQRLGFIPGGKAAGSNQRPAVASGACGQWPAEPDLIL